MPPDPIRMPGPIDIAAYTIGRGRTALAYNAFNRAANEDFFVAALADRPIHPAIAAGRPITFPANWGQISRLPTRQEPNYDAMHPAVREVAIQQALAYSSPPPMQYNPLMMNAGVPPQYLNPYMSQGCYMPYYMRQMMNPGMMVPGMINPIGNPMMPRILA